MEIKKNKMVVYYGIVQWNGKLASYAVNTLYWMPLEINPFRTFMSGLSFSC